MEEDFIYDQYLVSQHQFLDTLYNYEEDKNELKLSETLYDLWNKIDKVNKITVVNPESPFPDNMVISKEEIYHGEGISEIYLILNPQAIKIIEKARMLGCHWACEAEKELARIKAKY